MCDLNEQMATRRITSRPGLWNLGYSLTVPSFAFERDLMLWHQGGSTQNPANFRMARHSDRSDEDRPSDLVTGRRIQCVDPACCSAATPNAARPRSLARKAASRL